MVILRALHILVVGFAAGLAYLVLRIPIFFVRDEEARTRAVARLRGLVLRGAIAALGTTFVKLGQVMSTRVDLFDREVIEELRTLQDRLPAFPFADVAQTLEADLGRPPSELFAELDETPIAAASVAQVHRGRLHDGTEVAVKVLRPGVRRRAIADAAVLRAGARLLELHPELRLSKPVAHLDELEAGIVAQTDLRLEASNYEKFRQNFADDPEVVFPRVHEALCSEHVLTMDFLRGTKADALPPGDHQSVASLLSRTFMKMVFEHGLLHADLHPGNFLILDDGRVAVFDVGLVKHLSRERLDEFVDFTRCLTMGTLDDIVDHARRYHEYLEGTVDWAAFGKDLEKVLDQVRGKTKEEMELAAFFDSVFALGRKHRVRPITEFTLIIVGVVTAEGVGKMLDAKTDFLGEISMFLMPLLAERVAAQARADGFPGEGEDASA